MRPPNDFGAVAGAVKRLGQALAGSVVGHDFIFEFDTRAKLDCAVTPAAGVIRHDVWSIACFVHRVPEIQVGSVRLGDLELAGIVQKMLFVVFPDQLGSVNPADPAKDHIGIDNFRRLEFSQLFSQVLDYGRVSAYLLRLRKWELIARSLQ